ncbi:hypothetical protein ACUL41_16945 [Virgibacillus natechei]|uniref:hypothetical protein n=1 Tax=Virgibacillus sp. CBA3643 TaxID=2942278 RepID=UPI0035A2BCA3
MEKNLIKEEMERWIEVYCEKDKIAEEQFRNILLQNQYLVRNINKFFREGSGEGIKRLLNDYTRLKINKISCSNCKSTNIFLTSDESRKCSTCNHELVINRFTNNIKKCLYCNNPIAPNSNMVCVQHRNVKFEYW